MSVNFIQLSTNLINIIQIDTDLIINDDDFTINNGNLTIYNDIDIITDNELELLDVNNNAELVNDDEWMNSDYYDMNKRNVCNEVNEDEILTDEEDVILYLGEMRTEKQKFNIDTILKMTIIILLLFMIIIANI